MSTKKIVIIAITILFLVILILGGVFGYMYLQNKNAKEKADMKYYYTMDDINCNIKDSNRIIKLKITIETDEEKIIPIIEEKSFLIKNEINMITRSKTEEELEGKEGQELLQKEITNKLNEIFGTNSIKNIYFDILIIQ